VPARGAFGLVGDKMKSPSEKSNTDLKTLFYRKIKIKKRTFENEPGSPLRQIDGILKASGRHVRIMQSRAGLHFAAGKIPKYPTPARGLDQFITWLKKVK